MSISSLSRRKFLNLSIGGVAAAALPMSMRAYAIDPMTALSLSSSVLSAASMFASSGGGLDAMLHAQNEKLDLIVDQLNQISEGLSALRVDVSRLPTVIQGLLRYQYRDELINNIVGAGRQFATLYNSQQYDVNALRNDEARVQLRYVLATSQQMHSRLASLPEGRGPEAAAVATMALSTQLAAMGHLGFGRGLKLSTLDDYESWIRQMRSEDSGSIWHIAKEMSSRHDALLETLEKEPIWRNYSLDKARMGSSSVTISGSSHVPCNLLCDMNTAQNHIDIMPPVNYTLVSKLCPLGWGAESQLTFKNDEVLKARMLSYETGEGKVIFTTSGQVCTTQRWAPSRQDHKVYNQYISGKLSDSDIEALTRGNRSFFDVRKAAIAAKIAELNYYRARAAQCHLAFGLLDNLSDAMRQYRSYLS